MVGKNETLLNPEPVPLFTSFDSRGRMSAAKLGGAAETGSCVNPPLTFLISSARTRAERHPGGRNGVLRFRVDPQIVCTHSQTAIIIRRQLSDIEVVLFGQKRKRLRTRGTP